MSYTATVRNMLSDTEVKKSCCVRTELLLMRTFFAVNIDNECSVIPADSDALRKRITYLHRKVFGVRPQIIYRVPVRSESAEPSVLFRLSGFCGLTAEEAEKSGECCLKSVLRVSFLAFGRISDPSSPKTYIEFTPPDIEFGRLLVNSLEWFNIKCGSSVRRGKPLVYIKNLEGICDFLTITGANKATIDFQVNKAEREVRNGANRAVNCDMSNISRSSETGEKEALAVEKLINNGRFGSLPETLREIGTLRLDNREATLAELGGMIVPPISKSGASHRMKKILEEAGML